MKIVLLKNLAVYGISGFSVHWRFPTSSFGLYSLDVLLFTYQIV